MTRAEMIEHLEHALLGIGNYAGPGKQFFEKSAPVFIAAVLDELKAEAAFDEAQKDKQ